MWLGAHSRSEEPGTRGDVKLFVGAVAAELVLVWLASAFGDFAKEGHARKFVALMFAAGACFLGAMVLSDPVVDVIRRELRRVSPDVRIELDQIRDVLSTEVLKREVMEGDKSDEARKKIARAASKALRAKTERLAAGSAATDSAASSPSADAAA